MRAFWFVFLHRMNAHAAACRLQVLMRLAGYMGSEYLPLAARTFPAWRRLVQGHERAVHKPKGTAPLPAWTLPAHAWLVSKMKLG